MLDQTEKALLGFYRWIRVPRHRVRASEGMAMQVRKRNCRMLRSSRRRIQGQAGLPSEKTVGGQLSDSALGPKANSLAESLHEGVM